MVRPSSYNATWRLRDKLRRFTHRTRSMRGGTDKHNAPNYAEWGRRNTKAHDWCIKRFGPDGFTVASRPATDDIMQEIHSFCFATAQDAAAFEAFLDSPEADETVPRWP